MTVEGPIRHILVAGGGLTGYYAAAALKRRAPFLDVTLLATPVAPEALAEGPSYGGVLWWGDAETARRIDIALSERPGQIVPLIPGMPDVARVRAERHVCVDTTASGGNAALLGQMA